MSSKDLQRLMKMEKRTLAEFLLTRAFISESFWRSLELVNDSHVFEAKRQRADKAYEAYKAARAAADAVKDRAGHKYRVLYRESQRLLDRWQDLTNQASRELDRQSRKLNERLKVPAAGSDRAGDFQGMEK